MAAKFKVTTPNGPVRRILPGVGTFTIDQDLPDSIIEKFLESGVKEYFEVVDPGKEPAPDPVPVVVAEETEPEKKN